MTQRKPIYPKRECISQREPSYKKIGQTFGIFLFALLILFGKDPGNDLGVRLTGIAGFILSFIAAIYFARYNEKELLKELEK